MEQLIGRAPEQRQLLAMMEQAFVGSGAAVVVEGEPGIGKSTLLRTIAEHGASQGWAVLDGQCSELDIERPLEAISIALDELAGQLVEEGSTPSEARSELRKSSLAAHSPEAAHGEQLVRLIADALLEICASTPLLVIVDDLQWIDDATADVIWRVIRRRRSARLLVVLATRPTGRELVTRLRRGLDGQATTLVHLRALSSPDAEALASRVLGRPVDAGARRALDDANGNPLFITELLRGIDELDASGSEALDAVPPALRGLIERRLASLSPDAREALADAALTGLSARLDVVAALHSSSVESLSNLLGPAIELRLLVEADGALRFQHAVVQTIVASQRTEPVRRLRHRALADAAERIGAPTTEIAEQHWKSVPDHGPGAQRLLVRAATESRTRSVPTAIVWMERALDCAPDGARVFRLRLDLAGLHVLNGDVAAAEKICLDPRTAPRDDEERITWHSTLCALATIIGRARHDEALAHLDALDALLAPDDPRHVENVGWRALLHLFRGDVAGAVEPANSAFTIPVSGDRTPMLSRTHEALALAATLQADPVRATEHAALAEITLDEVINPFTALLTPHLGRSMAMLSSRPIGDVIAVLRSGWELCERSGYTMARRHLESPLAVFHLLRGDFAIARSIIATSNEEHTGWSDGGVALPSMGALHALLTLLDGDVASAKALADAALAELLGGGAQAGTADFAVWCIAEVEEAVGNRGGALDLLRDAWELYARDASLYTIAPDLVRLSVDVDRAFAAEVTRLAEARAERSGAAVDRAQALASRGFLDRDLMSIDEAAKAWEELDWSFAPTRLRTVSLREPCSRNLTHDERHLRLEQVIDAWSRMEAPSVVIGLRRQLETLTSRAAPRPAHGIAALTNTERRVMEMLADGRTNRQIATELFVSVRTVDTHVSHLLAKLGVASRVQVAGLVIAERTRSIGVAT